MKKSILFTFLIIFQFRLTANPLINLNSNRVVEFYYTENASLCMDLNYFNKKIDSFEIESIGPDINLLSITTDCINNNDLIFLEVYLGNPGGKQTLDERHLFVLKITDNNKFKLLLDEVIEKIHFSVTSNKYLSNKIYSYYYDKNTKDVLIYETYDYEFKTIKRISLVDLCRK